MLNRQTVNVLIIDDSVEIIKTLSELLKPDYTVFFATDGKRGIQLAKTKQPDLILLDVMMEPMNGYEVCRRLKEDDGTKEIPIIFVTSATDTQDEAQGFSIGASDYITKPFVPVVILARIHHHAQSYLNFKELKRLYSLALDANPITRLPGNNTIRVHIDDLLKKKANHYVLYCDLDNFKSYNDQYGFAKGDKVILATANLIQQVAKDMNISDAFFGHVGGDDFVVTVPSGVSEAFAETVLTEFDEMVRNFYSNEDLKLGYIVSKNRFGELVRFPFISISIAGVNLEGGNFSSYLEVSDHCSDVKQMAKKIEGSAFMRERRTTIG